MRAVTNDRPPLLLDGRSVVWSTLGPVLAETQGRAAVSEMRLDRALESELRARGITLDETALEDERRLLLGSIDRASVTGADEAELLALVRERRGLGPVRFQSLLRRNAGLRAIVRETPGSIDTVSDARVRLAYDLAHGELIDLRVVVTARDREASEARTEILQAPVGYRSSVAARIAADRSLDPSRARGGRLDRLSVLDPAAPRALRTAVERLEPGQVTGVVAVDRGFAIALVTARHAPDGVRFEDVEVALRADLETASEREAMRALARRLTARIDATPIDPSLAFSVGDNR
ncbi:MAG: peptidylprolyl isomerase [Planctomycetota bacterium]